MNKKVALSIVIVLALVFVGAYTMLAKQVAEDLPPVGLEFKTSSDLLDDYRNGAVMEVRNPDGISQPSSKFSFGETCDAGSGSHAKLTARLQDGTYLVRLTQVQPYFRSSVSFDGPRDFRCPEGTLTVMSASQIDQHRQNYQAEQESHARRIANSLEFNMKEARLREEIRRLAAAK